MPRGKSVLCSTKNSDFNIEQINDIAFYDRYKEFLIVANKHLGNIEDAETLLSEPSSNNGKTTWYIKSEQSAGIRLSDLMGVEKDQYTRQKDMLIKTLEDASNATSGNNEHFYIDCILKSLCNPYADDVIYCHNGKVTLGVWGMTPASSHGSFDGVITDGVKDHRVHSVNYVMQGQGSFSGATQIQRKHGYKLGREASDIPTVTPASRYEFKRWEPDAPQGAVVDGDLLFTAVCEHVDNYLISFLCGEGGRLDGETEREYKKGDSVVLPTPIAEDGYEFKGWSRNMEGYTVDDDCEIKAIFKKKDIVPPPPAAEFHKVRFETGENGAIESGFNEIEVEDGATIDRTSIPTIAAKNGFRFKGWDKSTTVPITGATTFNAVYEPVLPWYKRLWLWLTGLGCLKWLLWLLLFLLLLALFSFLLSNCRGCSRQTSIINDTWDGWFHSDNGVINNQDSVRTINGNYIEDYGNRINAPITGEDGLLIDDRDVVTPPTSGYNDETGEFSSVPIEEREGRPDVVSNRLLLFMENENGNIEGLAKDFKNAYPGGDYSVIGINKDVKLLAIQVPEAEKERVRNEINQKIPNHKFFVFDDELYEIKRNNSTDERIGEDGWHLNAIHLKEAWNITKGSPDIKIAIVDDGIDAAHPMFKGRIVDAYNVYTQTNRLGVGDGHGTHTAALAAGSADYYSKGAAGVAPNCKIMPVQVFDNGVCPLSALVAGIMYAVMHDADVINVSLCPSFEGFNTLPLQQQDRIAKNELKQVEMLWLRVSAAAVKNNSIIVFAAGNDDILASIPPENRSQATIVVTAVDKRLYPTRFTNYGHEFADISAPGKDICSAFPGGKLMTFDGTSMAAPIVSGTIALMKSIKKDLTIEQARNVLYKTGATVSGNIPPMVLVDKALEGVKRGDFSKPQKRKMNAVPGNVNVHLYQNEEFREGMRDGQISDDDRTRIKDEIEQLKEEINKREKLLNQN